MSATGKLWRAQLKRKATEAAANAVVQGVLWIIMALVVPYLGRYIPKFGGYLTTPVSVSTPLWVLVSVFLVVVGLSGMGLRRHNREKGKVTGPEAEVDQLRNDIERQMWRPETFSWGGAEWPLTVNFWGIVKDTSVEKFVTRGAAPSLLNNSIGDPLCRNPKCRRDIWRDAQEAQCRDCGTPFTLSPGNRISIEWKPVITKSLIDIKQEVYREARAAFMRGELRKSA